MKMKPIETDRLLLRPYTLDDAQEVWEYQRDPAVTKYTNDGGVRTLAEIESILQDVIIEGDYVEYGYGRMAVVHRESNKVIGFCGLKYLPELDQVDIGYRYAKEYWGQGLATEAGLAVMQFGWQELQLPRIIGMALPENKASVRVLEKLGLKFVHNDMDEGIDIVVYAADSPMS